MLGRIERARAQAIEQRKQREIDLAETQAQVVLAANIAEQQTRQALEKHPNYSELLEYANSQEVQDMMKEIWDYLTSKKIGVFQKQLPFRVTTSPARSFTDCDLQIRFNFLERVIGGQGRLQEDSFSLHLVLDEERAIKIGKVNVDNSDFPHIDKFLFDSPEAFLDAVALDLTNSMSSRLLQTGNS